MLNHFISDDNRLLYSLYEVVYWLSRWIVYTFFINQIFYVSSFTFILIYIVVFIIPLTEIIKLYFLPWYYEND